MEDPAPAERVRWRCRFSGRVQGVGFRAAAQRAARRRNLAGWVANLPNGEVDAAVEGPAPAVSAWAAELSAAFAAACRTEPEAPAGESGFDIRR
jgi:acylphosphatase